MKNEKSVNSLIFPSQLYLKRDSNTTQVYYCKICQVFKNVFFKEHLWATASETKEENRSKEGKICFSLSLSISKFWFALELFYLLCILISPHIPKRNKT